MSKLYGQTHREILEWLCGPWWVDGPAIHWVEGFPGIGKIPADKSLQSLYQFAAELLARDPERIGEAVALLKDGIGKIPVQYNGYKLAESLILLAAKAERPDWLEEFIAQDRRSDPNSSSVCLVEVLLKALEGDWEGAARTAARGRGRHPGYFALCAQEAYAWLAAGQPAAARDALNRYPKTINYPAGVGSTWLACFIALRNDDTETAARLYAAYRGEETTVPTPHDLLAAWNSPIPVSTPHPAHLFPIMPPALSGLEQTVIRPPNNEPANSPNASPGNGVGITPRKPYCSISKCCEASSRRA